MILLSSSLSRYFPMIANILLLTLSQSPQILLRFVKKSMALATGTALATLLMLNPSERVLTFEINDFLSNTCIALSNLLSLSFNLFTCFSHFLIMNLFAKNLFLSSQFSNNCLIMNNILLNSTPSLNWSTPTFVSLYLTFSAISLNLSQFLNLDLTWYNNALLIYISYLSDNTFQLFLAVAILYLCSVHLAILFSAASLVIFLAWSFHCKSFLLK